MTNRHTVAGTGTIREVASLLCDISAKELRAIAAGVYRCATTGGIICLAGNGGSLANLQHFATDLRRLCPLARVVLPSEPSQVSADANDFSWETAFAKSLGAFFDDHAVLLTASVSGASRNLIEVAQRAREVGAQVFLLTSTSGGRKRLASLASVVVCVDSSNARVVETVHAALLLNGVMELITEIGRSGAGVKQRDSLRWASGDSPQRIRRRPQGARRR